MYAPSVTVTARCDARSETP